MNPYRSLEPRRTPRQARSNATVDVILDSTIQILLAEGTARLTTNRVAARAGVSIGTMYQYFPHKRALLYAVLERHLGTLMDEVEAAALRLHHQPLSTMAVGLADAYFDVNTREFEVCRAIYWAVSEWGANDFDGAIPQRMSAIIKSLLATASDATFGNLDEVSFMLQESFSGVMRAIYMNDEKGTPVTLRKWRKELAILTQGYLIASRQSQDAEKEFVAPVSIAR